MAWPMLAEWRADAAPGRFDGHFPGHVVLPGAYVLDGVIERLESVCAVRVLAVRSAKFTAALTPDAVLEIRALVEPGQIRFAALHGEQAAVSGVLRLAARTCA
ncbi:MAG: hypothetical protein QM772_01005 [Ottowia sp.]|uniref:hypothetical protein n=1 Tax=Ottowia sp. TaxID=1898956 RepID=UPI0039E702D2